MKINSISVFNFGKLKDFSLDFDSDLNIICERNGWGKSTITAFIKVMLYGFDNEGSRDEFVKERKRYFPWHGGTYGGSMTFTVDNRKYKLTRIFHEKQSLDEFDLRDFDTNMPSSDYSVNIGEELFKINSESFSKTVFIKQSDSAVTGVSGDINSKLGNISDSIDLNKFESALKLLQNKSNFLWPTRKTGEIYKLKNRASEIKGELKGVSSLEKSIDEVSERISEANSELKKFNDSLSEIKKQKDIAVQYEKNISIRKSYNQINQDVELKLKELNGAKAEFGDKIPGEDTISSWNDYSRDINVLETTMTTLSLDSDEQSKYESLSSLFALADINENELNSMIILSSELDEIKKSAAVYELSSDEKQKLDNYSKRFSKLENPLVSVREKLSKLNDINSIKAQVDALRDELKAMEKDITNLKKSRPFAYIAIAILLVIVSVGSLLVGGFKLPFVIAGLALLIMAILMTYLFVRKFNRIKNEINELDVSYKEAAGKLGTYEQKLTDANEDIEVFLDTIGEKTESGNYSLLLQNLMLDASEYETLVNKARNRNKYLTESKFDDKNNVVMEFARKLNVNFGNSVTGALSDINGKYQLYKSLSAKKKNYDRAKVDYDKLTAGLKESLVFHNVDPGLDLNKTIDRLNNLYADISYADKAYSDAVSTLNTFMENNPGFDKDAVMTEQTVTLESLIETERNIEQSVEGINARINTDKRTLMALTEDYERKQELADELEEIENAISDKTVVYDRLIKTQEFLGKAKENLTAKYMGPLLDGFKKYYTMLTGESADDYYLDANINLTRVIDGMQRETKALSVGYQDLDGMCMRLAMADAMYPDEKPVLVLDDPFVNLDDDKTAKLKEFLSNLSKEYQIIYMTCSDSRK